ncbi:hypothetical protein NNO04_21365 [Citrobacter sp. Awk 4]|uniref:hypothetical protein n=1 Tax=Citrobacter sp. Awk 4 TaxID=2963955 RepID=UPI0023027D39|nr:hypothetical protein [Citrobacter sp. Awk 4]MDA8481217.1 hypothetical protein [Citrobacter sp. Awk 4]
MSYPIICDGDGVQFGPMFGTRQVVLVEPAFIRGSGAITVMGRKACVAGDESQQQWAAQYFIPGYTPGSGMVSIEMLDGSQVTPCITAETSLILQGTQFTARFTLTSPAVMSEAPYTPDGMAVGMGRGCFIPQQVFVRAG